ncbi:DUF732 domain-containing protein [Mycobacterium sp. ITM-2016-00316]|uniref:DUF732 domain-containing protein n=1 Tax=Mycobacterium sp. ITM-2016-00316 TaxID=2099695 RepID=UPI001305002E|nr:DUF732 domain-containing protein [Mycobacterium sp. ITM-2016-00316]WNG80889.1 DUF732 domain-containing protein [Mycobacterium sp. ITM-2016-00316]
MFAVQRLIQSAGLALVAGLSGLATAGTASAITSADDAAFLADIRYEGISYESAVQVISNAHEVCAELDSGVQATDIGLDILEYTDLNTRQAAAFIVMSIGYYCPQHTGAFA